MWMNKSVFFSRGTRIGVPHLKGVAQVVLLLTVLFYSCGNKDSIPETVTFTEHVAPILYGNCSICHRPGGSAHFSLVTYEDARKNAGATAFVVKERLMPPWPADPHYTSFIGQRVLSEREIKILEKWQEEGAPKGPVDKMPAFPKYPDGSDVGIPDIRIAVAPYFIKGNSSDQFLLVKVPFELRQDTFASLIEFIPGKHNVVHHVNGDMVSYEFDKKKDVFTGERALDMQNDTAKILEAFND